MLTRDIPFIVPAMPETLLATCSALYTTGSTGVVTPIADTTADALIASAGETTGFGRVVDRTRFPLGTKYDGVVAQSWVTSTRGSTEADRKITIGCRLQHGDSSGGGDMADYPTTSTQSGVPTQVVRQYFSTARTTDMLAWDATESSGALYAPSNPSFYDIRNAKRYVRVAVPVQKNRVTTESSGDEQSRVGASLAFVAGVTLAQKADTTGPFSGTTTTA